MTNPYRNDLNNLFKVTKELDALAEFHKEALAQACMEGNQKALAYHLGKKDFMLIPSLLSTCVYHNQAKTALL